MRFEDSSAAAREYRAATAQAALFDISAHGKIEVLGPEARTFLQNLSTNDVNGLAVGAGCEAFLTTGQAKIIAAVLIYRAPPHDAQESIWLDTGPDLAEKVMQHLDRHLISERVELRDHTRACAQIHLAGPQAGQVLEKAAATKLPELGPLQHSLITLEQLACPVRRYERLGLPGYDILVPLSGDAKGVKQLFTDAGALPCGPQTYEILRVEAGTPLYGRDIDESNLPQEVNRVAQTISFTKGCYIGQETVARIRTYGHVNRTLVGMKLSGAQALPAGCKLGNESKDVGHLTSSVVSPRAGAIALGYVRRGCEKAGTILEIEGGQGTAEVVSLPFVGS
jgi:folate-binding protein YgfZ